MSKRKNKVSNFQRLAMSKSAGKVLDSSVGKKMVGVGNMVKKVASAPFKFVGAGIEKELRNQKAQDDKYRANAPRGAYGTTLAPGELYNKYKAKQEAMKKKKNWIAGAIKKPGALHKQLGIKPGKKISVKVLAKAVKKGGKLGKRAQLAKTLKSFSKKKSEFAPAKLPMKGDMAYKKGNKKNCK